MESIAERPNVGTVATYAELVVVRVHAAKVGAHNETGGELGVCPGHLGGGEDLGDELVQLVMSHDDSRHVHDGLLRTR